MADCELPPPGWICIREAPHSGPCAAVPDASTYTPDELQALHWVGIAETVTAESRRWRNRYEQEHALRVGLEQRLSRRRKTIANLEECRAFERETEWILKETLDVISTHAKDLNIRTVANQALALYHERLGAGRG